LLSATNGVPRRRPWHGARNGVGTEITTRADGNPLFIEELSQAVTESAAAAQSSDGVVSTTLQDSLMDRLDRMAQAKPIARVAAVRGREFTSKLLSAAASKELRSPPRLDRDFHGRIATSSSSSSRR
jgi:predicted ATPase